MKKIMDKKTLVIIIMSIIILAGAGVFAYQNITQKAYNQGIQDATLIINQQILNSLNQNGYVPFVYNFQNQTINIKLIPSENKNSE